LKFPISILCQGCLNSWTIEVTGHDTPETTRCDKCGASIWLFDHGFVSTKVLARARGELQSGDFSLAIILSAMSVECDLARLFFKWTELDAELAGSVVTQTDKEQWEDQFRKFGIPQKLDTVCRLLANENFDSFLRRDDSMQKWIRRQHPTLVNASAATYFQENLFWKRNRIVHFAKIDFQKDDADKALLCAGSLLQLLHAMDMERAKRLDEQLGLRTAATLPQASA
jgi:hypothetical protein